MSNTTRKYSTGVKLPIINERFLTLVLKILSCKDVDISRRTLNNIKDLLSVIDMNYYSKDLNVYTLIESIKITLKHRYKLEKKINLKTVKTEIEVTLPETYNEVKTDIIFPTIDNSDVVLDIELEMMTKTIDMYLKYGSIMLSKDELSSIITKLTTGNITQMGDSLNDFRNVINIIGEEFRKSDDLNSDIIHSIDDEYFESLREAYRKIKSGNIVLKTGSQMFNEALSEDGGFLLGRYYMFYASINSFKSAILQYIRNWLRKYNSDVFRKVYEETGRIPVILYYSLENSKIENAQRDFTMETGLDMREMLDEDEMMDKFLEAFNSTNSFIDIVSIYDEANKVKPSDIAKQIDMLNDSGYIVVSCIVDYIELMAAEEEDKHLDNRLKLARISTQFLSLAIKKNILMISAHQINRDGEDTLQDQRDKGFSNVVKSIGRRFIGEAYAIDKPVDCSFYLALERSIYDNKLYLTMKRDKCRYKKSKLDYFVTELINGFYIKDDIYMDKPLGKKAIMPEDNSELGFASQQPVKVGRRGVESIRDKKKTEPAKSEIIKPKTEIKEKEEVISPEDLMGSFTSLFSNINLEDYFMVANNFISPFDTNLVEFDGYVFSGGF